MLKTMQSAERDAIFAVADLMAAAAKTAPKGSGRDTIVTAIVSGETKDQLRDKLTELGTKYEEAFMVRDAGNVDNSTCVLLIGCTDTYMGLNHCSMCGFANCGETKKHGSPCIFNVSDLGIAVGSAVCVAADHRIDNRVMYSAGRAAVKLGLLGDNVKLCYAIPLSTTNKSIYFDRNPGAVLRWTPGAGHARRAAVPGAYRQNKSCPRGCGDPRSAKLSRGMISEAAKKLYFFVFLLPGQINN